LEGISQKERPPNHPSPHFKEKEKVGEGSSKAWWSMEGEGEGVWLGGKWKEKEKVLGLVANGRRERRFLAWWPMEGGRESSFLPLPLFPQATLLKPSFFILHIKVLLRPGPRPLFTPSLRFPWPINYDRIS
jgi:hypothetical protein